MSDKKSEARESDWFTSLIAILLKIALPALPILAAVGYFAGRGPLAKLAPPTTDAVKPVAPPPAPVTDTANHPRGLPDDIIFYLVSLLVIGGLVVWFVNWLKTDPFEDTEGRNNELFIPGQQPLNPPLPSPERTEYSPQKPATPSQWFWVLFIVVVMGLYFKCCD